MSPLYVTVNDKMSSNTKIVSARYKAQDLQYIAARHPPYTGQTMANPTPYKRSFSFENYQTDVPDQPLPGVRVDIELDDIAQKSKELTDVVNAGFIIDANMDQIETVVDEIDKIVFVADNMDEIRDANEYGPDISIAVDLFLGAYAADPSVGHNDDPLVLGATYYNTTIGESRVWNGASWVPVAKVSLGGVLQGSIEVTTGTEFFIGDYVSLSVALNGVVLAPGIEYSLTAPTIVIPSAEAGDVIVYYGVLKGSETDAASFVRQTFLTTAGVQRYTLNSAGAPLNLTQDNHILFGGSPFGPMTYDVDYTVSAGGVDLAYAPAAGELYSIFSMPRFTNTEAQVILQEYKDEVLGAVERAEEAASALIDTVDNVTHPMVLTSLDPIPLGTGVEVSDVYVSGLPQFSPDDWEQVGTQLIPKRTYFIGQELRYRYRAAVPPAPSNSPQSWADFANFLGYADGSVVWFNGVAFERDQSANIAGLGPGAGWKPVGVTDTRHFEGAYLTAVQSAVAAERILHTVGGSVAGFVPASGGDAAIKVRDAAYLTGDGTHHSVIVGDGNSAIMAIGPVSFDPDAEYLKGAIVENLSLDAGFDTDNPSGWVDNGRMTLWASGHEDLTVQNVQVVNSPDYAFGLQNGRRIRSKLRDLVSVGSMNDALDTKNNFSRSRDNSIIGMWAEGFGRGTGSGQFAGLDLSEPNWSVAQVWCTGWGEGHVADGIRFKIGEVTDTIGRGLGGYKAQLGQFHVEYEGGSEFSTPSGVRTDHRKTIISEGHIGGALHSGIRVTQEQAIIAGVDVDGVGRGIYAHINGHVDAVTEPTDILSLGVRVSNNTSEALRLDEGSDNGLHLGVQNIGGVRFANIASDYNFILGSSRGHSAVNPVIDTGEGNSVWLWDQGVLKILRGGTLRQVFGDNFRADAAVGAVAISVGRVGQATPDLNIYPSFTAGRPRFDGASAVDLAVGGAVKLAVNGGDLTASVPVRLNSYSVAGLPAASGVSRGLVWCSNGDAGQPCLAVSDGTSWRRISLGAAVSAT